MPLLDKIGKIASTATLTPAPEAQAATESKASSYTERLAQSKGEVQERINRLLLELGRAYYKHHADDHQTELEEQLAAIREAYRSEEHTSELQSPS